MLTLNDIFSFQEAHEYLGVPEGTWIDHNYSETRQRVEPIRLGERDGAAYTVVYTKRMLDLYKEGQPGIIRPTKHELDQIFHTAAAAEYLGLSQNGLRYHIHTAKNLPSRLIGSSRVILKRDLDAFQARRRGPGRPRKEE